MVRTQTDMPEVETKQRITKRYPPELWAKVREAVALGSSLQDAASQYGIHYDTVKTRARLEDWPRPHKLPPPEPDLALLPSPAQAASNSLARRGELHRERVASLVEQALAAALPPALNNWSDIATAVKLGNQAFGLDKPEGSIVSINFPATSSSEAPAYIDISTNFPSDTTNALEAGQAGEGSA